MTTRSLILHDYEVRAALAGTLGLVVRPVKFRSDINFNDVHFSSFHSTWGPDSWVFSTPLLGPVGYETISVGMKCPLGVPGGRLCCKESYYIQDTHGQHRTDGLRWGSWSGLPTTVSPDGKRVVYYKEGFDRSVPCWRSPATMPAWASRITLEVVGVRCMRLAHLADDDAVQALGAWRKGDEDDPFDEEVTSNNPLGDFRTLWTAKYGTRYPWETSWAWAVEVRRVEG